MWVIDHSTAVHKMVADLNRKKSVSNLRTCDFSTLYTDIPQKLKARLSQVIKQAFASSHRSFIRVYKNDARWTNSHNKEALAMGSKNIIHLLSFSILCSLYCSFLFIVF
mgnify:CR=1 FL=1